jgi:hypothetical protein
MGKWTHNICRGCYNEMYKHNRNPATIKGDYNSCCWCGIKNQNGIYVREDPKEVPCQGIGGAHREDK